MVSNRWQRPLNLFYRSINSSSRAKMWACSQWQTRIPHLNCKVFKKNWMRTTWLNYIRHYSKTSKSLIWYKTVLWASAKLLSSTAGKTRLLRLRLLELSRLPATLNINIRTNRRDWLTVTRALSRGFWRGIQQMLPEGLLKVAVRPRISFSQGLWTRSLQANRALRICIRTWCSQSKATSLKRMI